MARFFKILFFVLFSMHAHASSGIFGKETIKITCEDINSLSVQQIEMLSMGVMLGTTAEGVAVSIFSRVGLENEDDQAYIKGVSYSAFSSLSPELIVNKITEICNRSENSGMQLVDIIVGLIQDSLLSNN